MTNEKSKNVTVICDEDGTKIVLINDIRFKGKTREEWDEVEVYLKEYIGKFYEIAETAEKIYIGKEFPDEFVHGKDKTVLMGPNAKAKANASQAIGELIQIATNKTNAPIILNMVVKQNMVGIVMILDWRCLFITIMDMWKDIIFLKCECL